MMCLKGKQLFMKGTASAVTKNLAVNVTKHRRPPCSFAVIDRQSVHVVIADNDDGGGCGDGPSASADDPGDRPQCRLDTNVDYVTQVKRAAPG